MVFTFKFMLNINTFKIDDHNWYSLVDPDNDDDGEYSPVDPDRNNDSGLFFSDRERVLGESEIIDLKF